MHHEGPQHIQSHPSALTLVVVFERPKDYPHKYVVRRQFVRTGGAIYAERSAMLFDTEDEAHGFVHLSYPDATLLHGRGVDPDPDIIGVYV